jgi:hypothetical protein
MKLTVGFKGVALKRKESPKVLLVPHHIPRSSFSQGFEVVLYWATCMFLRGEQAK